MTKQQRQVVAFIEKHGSINSLQAIERFNITRLAAVIFDLKKLGYEIIKSEERKYAVYSIKGMEKKNTRGWLGAKKKTT